MIREREKLERSGRLVGVRCCTKPLRSVRVPAAQLTEQALGPASPQVSKAWRDVVPVHQTFLRVFFQDLVVNVSTLESCVWSQGLGGKRVSVYMCVQTPIRSSSGTLP